MSTKRMERVFPLLMTVLMIATAFIPAVSAAGPNTSNVDTTSWINTSAEIESAGEPGEDTSPATDITRVVTGSGKIRLKTYDPETGTIRITDESRSAADGDLEIRLVNTTPDLGTFTEIFEITAHSTIALDESEDFLATWALHNGEENATRAEWFVWENRLHTVEIPIIEYRNVTLEINTSENRTFENVTRGETLPETATVREPYIAGTETREQYWYEWVPFDPAGQTLNAGEARTFKVVYTKPAEIGQVDINTAPVFRGVACPEMTWWSTAWTARVPITVINPPTVDNYSHREVVSFLPGMQDDFDDVRFATDDGTVLDYWKESYTASDSAVIWVNLPAGATLIWMYYGNAAATNTGDPNRVFILYDDFNGPDLDTTIWTDTTPGAHYFSDGWVYDKQSRGAGWLISNDNVITDGEPVIVEMHIHADSLASPGYACGMFPGLGIYTNGMWWYQESSNWDRYVLVNGVASWRPGASRGLAVGGDYHNTWIITPSGQTHTVSGSASFTDVFAGTTGISNHRLYILGGDNSVSGRVMRMDWIRARKYVETEPTFAYGTPETYLTYSFCVEWVGDYHGMQTPLFSAEEEAEGFYDTLEGSSSWTGQFINGNDAAMERHWKDPAFGGEDSDYIDNAHLAFFVGHGWDGGFVFGTAADDYELNYSEARWGNTKTDWIILGSCSTLNASTCRENWEDAFEGLHSICGFDTTGAAHPDMGWYFAQKLMNGETIKKAWFMATDRYVFPNDGSLRSAILAADIDGDLSTPDCLDDHIYGYGSSINPPSDPPDFQYETNQCEQE